jgi:hypothetical protein
MMPLPARVGMIEQQSAPASKACLTDTMLDAFLFPHERRPQQDEGPHGNPLRPEESGRAIEIGHRHPLIECREGLCMNGFQSQGHFQAGFQQVAKPQAVAGAHPRMVLTVTLSNPRRQQGDRG